MTKKQEALNRLYITLGKIFADILQSNGTNTFKGPHNERQEAVVAAFKHAWKGYKTFAWGHDNLRPMSERPFDWMTLGTTIVNSLDTMYIMNLKEGTQHTFSSRVYFSIAFKMIICAISIIYF